MAPKLSLEARMTIQELSGRGWSNSSIAETLEVTEGTVRYHLRRQKTGATDGRSEQEHLACSCSESISAWLESHKGSALNLAALHAYLVSEHGYEGSLRSVQRYYRSHYPAPRKRARRRCRSSRSPSMSWFSGVWPAIAWCSSKVILTRFLSL